ncbi:MAG: hypothetical protein ACLGRW_09960 [Acidobacteriota bacterium]
MNESKEIDMNDQEHPLRDAEDLSPRMPASPTAQNDARRLSAVASPRRVFPGKPQSGPHSEEMPGMKRAVGALRMAVPFVQRLLPLLDGKIGTAVSNLLIPPPQPAPPPVNLAPIGDGLTDLQTQHKELRDQVAEQNASLKRMAEQLEALREAANLSSAAQQELRDDLEATTKRFGVVAIAALALLAITVVLNVFLFLRVDHVLR